MYCQDLLKNLSLVHNDAGTVSVMEKKYFYQSNCIPDIKFFDNLISWTLANAGDVTLKKK